MASCAVSEPQEDTQKSLSGPSPSASAPHHACASQCHDPAFDLPVVMRLAQVVIESAACPAAEALLDLRSAPTVEAMRAARPILRCLRLMHLCGFSQSDLQVVAAHAAVYLEECLPMLKKHSGVGMGLQEVSFIICVLLFIAHSYALDQNCPLRIWQKHVFERYCNIQSLNTAVVRLMELRGFKMRVDSEALVNAMEAMS